MAFMRIRSPKSAPPDFRRDGSTDTMATVRSGKSRRNRRTSSSTMEDLPAPPVPVMPSTGTRRPADRSASAAWHCANASG